MRRRVRRQPGSSGALAGQAFGTFVVCLPAPAIVSLSFVRLIAHLTLLPDYLLAFAPAPPLPIQYSSSSLYSSDAPSSLALRQASGHSPLPHLAGRTGSGLLARLARPGRAPGTRVVRLEHPIVIIVILTLAALPLPFAAVLPPFAHSTLHFVSSSAPQPFTPLPPFRFAGPSAAAAAFAARHSFRLAVWATLPFCFARHLLPSLPFHCHLHLLLPIFLLARRRICTIL